MTTESILEGGGRRGWGGGEGVITIASFRNGTMGKQWPGYDLIEESEKVRETHGGEDPDRDDKVLVGVRTGGLT